MSPCPQMAVQATQIVMAQQQHGTYDTNMIPHSGLDPLPRHGFQWYQVFVVYVLSAFYTHRGNPCLMKNWQGCFLLFCDIFTLLIHLLLYQFSVYMISIHLFYYSRYFRVLLRKFLPPAIY